MASGHKSGFGTYPLNESNHPQAMPQGEFNRIPRKNAVTMLDRCTGPAASALKTVMHSCGTALLGGAVLMLSTPARALTWSWSYQRAADSSGPAVSASGRLVTTNSPDPSGYYTINSITGQRNSVPISGLLPAGSFAPGNCTPTICFTSDNLLRKSQGVSAQLNTHGFNVSFIDGTYANYFFASFLSPPAYLEYFSVPPFGFLPAVPPDSELAGSFQATPIPGPLPAASVIFGLGWARRLRQRQRT